MAGVSAGMTMKYVPNIPVINATSLVVGTTSVKILNAKIVEAAKEIAPVDTGAYRDSITSRAAGIDGIVFSDLRYAPYLEFGTSDTPTFATLRRASEMVEL